MSIDLRARLAAARTSSPQPAPRGSRLNLRERLRVMNRRSRTRLADPSPLDAVLLKLMEEEVDRQILMQRDGLRPLPPPYWCHIAPDLMPHTIETLMNLYRRVGWETSYRSVSGRGDFLILRPRRFPGQAMTTVATAAVPW